MEMISEEHVITYFLDVTEAIRQLDIVVTFFEITLMMALLHFRDCGCEFVVLEVGIGGLIDATNIVDPFMTCITEIGLDHTDVLGDTIEKIAAHKAGIIK